MLLSRSRATQGSSCESSSDSSSTEGSSAMHGRSEDHELLSLYLLYGGGEIGVEWSGERKYVRNDPRGRTPMTFERPVDMMVLL